MVKSVKGNRKQKGIWLEADIGKSFVSEVKSGNGSCIDGIVVLQDLIGAQAENKRMDKPRSAQHDKW